MTVPNDDQGAQEQNGSPGEAGGPANGQATAEFGFPLIVPAEGGEGESGTFSQFVPPEYRDKPYVVGLLDKPPAEAQLELFKKLEGQESLIGKKTIASFPDIETATPEEMLEFHTKVRPAEAAGYNVDIGVKLEEGAELTEAQTAYKTGVQDMFFEAGISPWQAEKLTAGFNALTATLPAQGDKEGFSDEEFNTMADTAFGNEKALAMKRSKALVDKYATPEFNKFMLENADDKSVIALATILNGVHKDYIVEDDLSDHGGSGASGANEKQLREEMTRLQGNEAYNNSMHPEYASVRKKVTDISQRLAKLNPTIL